MKSTEPFIRLTDPAATHSTPASSSLPAITQPSASHRQASRKDSISSLESEADSEFSDRPLLDLYVEEGDLSADQDVTVTDQDKAASEEQTYRETMRGIRTYMGWSHIQDMDTFNNTAEENPFAGPKTQVPGKVSVQMPVDDWLCRKLSKLNITLVEGYPSQSSEAGGLLKDQFLRPAKPQAKWYGLYSDNKDDSTAVSTWNTDASRLKSSYSRIELT